MFEFLRRKNRDQSSTTTFLLSSGTSQTRNGALGKALASLVSRNPDPNHPGRAWRHPPSEPPGVLASRPGPPATWPRGADVTGPADGSPCGMAWAGNGPSNAPTGRALTKGIWSFFQNKYKNHVKPLDPRWAAACWPGNKCHVAPHGVSVITGLGISRKHPKSEEGGHGQRALPGVGVRLQPRGEGRHRLHNAHQDDTERAAFCTSGKYVQAIVSATAGPWCWAGKGGHAPLTPCGARPGAFPGPAFCFVSSPAFQLL